MVMRVLDHQVGLEFRDATQDALVQRVVPVHVRRDVEPAGTQFIGQVLEVRGPLGDEILAQPAQRVGVEERLARQRGIEVADEEFERGAAEPGQARRLRGTDLHVHCGIDHGQDPIEALHDVPPDGTRVAAHSLCDGAARAAMRRSHFGKYVGTLIPVPTAPSRV